MWTRTGISRWPRSTSARSSRNISPLKPRAEPEQRGEKRLTVKAPAKEPYLLIGYKTPVLGHAAEPWEPYAAGDAGLGARRRQQFALQPRAGARAAVAASAGASYNAFTRLPGMLLLDGSPPLVTASRTWSRR
jgi:zinc protease